MHCPKCKSHQITRSHSRGLEKIGRVLFLRWYYRCQKCGWRGSLAKKIRVRWEKTILVIVYCVILAFILRACINYQPSSGDNLTAALRIIENRP